MYPRDARSPGRELRWCATVVVVGAVVHCRISSGGEAFLVIVGSIEVGQPHYVTELMYEGAYAYRAVSVADVGKLPLVAAGVAVQAYVVESIDRAGLGSVQSPGMRPYAVGTASRRLSAACIYNKYIVDISVAVAVEPAEIHRGIELSAGFDYHLWGALSCP